MRACCSVYCWPWTVKWPHSFDLLHFLQNIVSEAENGYIKIWTEHSKFISDCAIQFSMATMCRRRSFIFPFPTFHSFLIVQLRSSKISLIHLCSFLDLVERLAVRRPSVPYDQLTRIQDEHPAALHIIRAYFFPSHIKWNTSSAST